MTIAQRLGRVASSEGRGEFASVWEAGLFVIAALDVKLSLAAKPIPALPRRSGLHAASVDGAQGTRTGYFFPAAFSAGFAGMKSPFACW